MALASLPVIPINLVILSLEWMKREDEWMQGMRYLKATQSINATLTLSYVWRTMYIDHWCHIHVHYIQYMHALTFLLSNNRIVPEGGLKVKIKERNVTIINRRGRNKNTERKRDRDRQTDRQTVIVIDRQ